MLRLYGPEWRRCLTRRRGWLISPWFSLKGYKLVGACVHLVHLRTNILSAHLQDIFYRGVSHHFWGTCVRPGVELISDNPIGRKASPGGGDQSRTRVLCFNVVLVRLMLSRTWHGYAGER